MKEVAKAIITKFKAVDNGGNNTTLFNLVDGQMYNTRALQTATMPYIVFTFPSTTPEYTFNTAFERVQVQFNCYSIKESTLEIEAIRQALISLFDYCQLTIDGHTHLYMRRMMSRLSSDDRPAYVYTIQYQLYAEKS